MVRSSFGAAEGESLWVPGLMAEDRVTITLVEERIVTDMPAGVVTWGPATVKVGKEIE